MFDFQEPASLLREIELPDIGTVVTSHGKHDSNEFIYKFTSFADPGSSYRVDLNTFEVTTVSKTALTTGLDITQFKTD